VKSDHEDSWASFPLGTKVSRCGCGKHWEWMYAWGCACSLGWDVHVGRCMILTTQIHCLVEHLVHGKTCSEEARSDFVTQCENAMQQRWKLEEAAASGAVGVEQPADRPVEVATCPTGQWMQLARARQRAQATMLRLVNDASGVYAEWRVSEFGQWSQLWTMSSGSDPVPHGVFAVVVVSDGHSDLAAASTTALRHLPETHKIVGVGSTLVSQSVSDGGIVAKLASKSSEGRVATPTVVAALDGPGDYELATAIVLASHGTLVPAPAPRTRSFQAPVPPPAHIILGGALSSRACSEAIAKVR
jgi:hypothetical protein